MQQINLYRAQFPRKDSVKIPKKYAIIVIIVFVSIAFAASYSYQELGKLKLEYFNIQKNSDISKSAIEKAKKAIEVASLKKKPESELASIQDKLQHKSLLKNRLKQTIENGSRSFFQVLLALSNQDIQGLWLTDIELSDSGDDIKLHGYTQRPELLTSYIQHLASEEIFSGISFSVLRLSSDIDNNSFNELEFTLSTQELEVNEELIEEELTPLQRTLKSMKL